MRLRLSLIAASIALALPAHAAINAGAIIGQIAAFVMKDGVVVKP